MSSNRIILDDLFMLTEDAYHHEVGDRLFCVDGDMRQATFDDLIQVLKGMGAEIEEAHVVEGYTKVDTPGLGSYLVLRLPGDKK